MAWRMADAVALSPETLEQLVGRIFTKITNEYDRWLYFVLHKKKEVSEEAHLRGVEEYIHPLFNLALTISLKGKLFQREDLDLALQRELSAHARRLFGQWTAASPAQVGKADAYKLLYQSRMMCAMVNLAEEDTFLNSVKVPPRGEQFSLTPNAEADLFVQAYAERKLFLESRDAEIGLREYAVEYLGFKEGMKRIVEQHEHAGIPLEYEPWLARIISLAPGKKPVLLAAASGYKARLHLLQATLQLMPVPGELPNLYPTLRNRLQEHLGLERACATKLVQELSFISERPADPVLPAGLGERVEEAYTLLYQSAGNMEEAQQKMAAFSKFFIQLPYVSPEQFPKNILSELFSRLSREREMELRTQEPKQAEGPRRFSFASLYTSPAYRSARARFLSYQLVSLHLAEQPPSYGNHEVTRRILAIPPDVATDS